MPAPPNALRGNGLRVQCAQTIMRSAEDKAALAREVLSFMTESRSLTQRTSAPRAALRRNLTRRRDC
jgi:hypothetical protein